MPSTTTMLYTAMPCKSPANCVLAIDVPCCSNAVLVCVVDCTLVAGSRLYNVDFTMNGFLYVDERVNCTLFVDPGIRYCTVDSKLVLNETGCYSDDAKFIVLNNCLTCNCERWVN